MAAADNSRKLLCNCGKQVATFTARGIEVYCRFSKETTIVPYSINSVHDGIAFEEQRRRARRPAQGRRDQGRKRPPDGTVKKSGR